MVEFHLWLQVHLLVYIVHVGGMRVHAHVLFQQHMPEWGSVHVFTAKLPAAVSCKAAGVTLTCTGLSATHESFCGSLSTL